jgi:uncharacterized membrane protein
MNSSRLRFLVIILLTLGIFFRFIHLEQKPYWGDEADSLNWISGCTKSELMQTALKGNPMRVEEVLKYQRPCPDKKFTDTITAIAEVPEHPPLYYLIARPWMELFKITPRGLSAIISLLVFPGVYWLCLELFESSLVGWIAIAVTAISPVHLIYAQEVREYSLWTVAILLLSWALLKAIRINTKLNWSIYTVILMLGFYTHILSVIIVIAHGIYVAIRENFKFSKIMINYLLGTLASILLFIPWILVILGKWNSHLPSVGTSQTPRGALMQTWVVDISRIFVDLNDSFNYQKSYIYLLVFILVIYSIYFLCRNTLPKTYLFILSLILVSALLLGLPDLILGKQRFVGQRYWLPCYLGIQIAVSYLITCKINHSMCVKSWQHKSWLIITVVLISSGVLSCAVRAQTDTWWNKHREYYHSEVAKIINQSNHPLVLAAWFDMRTLSHSLDLDVSLQDIRLKQDVKSVGKGFEKIFVYKDKGILDYFIVNHSNYKIKNIYCWKRSTIPVTTATATLWELEKK